MRSLTRAACIGCGGVSVEPRPAASLILLRRGGKHRDSDKAADEYELAAPAARGGGASVSILG